MMAFIFRTPRLETNLTMQVGLQEISSGELLPEQLTTTVVNFSHEGACFILPSLDIGGKHLFFTSLNSDEYYLFLQPENDQDDDAIITAQSVWMDSCEYQGSTAFKIGVEFVQNQKKLFKRIKKGEFS